MLFKRKLHLIGSALHQNVVIPSSFFKRAYKLPLRALFKKLDGMTTGPGSLSGLIGKRCTENIQDTHQVFFEPVTNPIVDGHIPEEVLKNLSSDQ